LSFFSSWKYPSSSTFFFYYYDTYYKIRVNSHSYLFFVMREFSDLSTPPHLLSLSFQIPQCSSAGCDKLSRGSSGLCAGHGGGSRCGVSGCERPSFGRLFLCRSHATLQPPPPAPTPTPLPSHSQQQQVSPPGGLWRVSFKLFHHHHHLPIFLKQEARGRERNSGRRTRRFRPIIRINKRDTSRLQNVNGRRWW